MKTVLITGASGFVGTHLIEHFLSLGDVTLYGTYRSEKPQKIHDNLQYLQADFQKKGDVDSVFNQIRPDWIVHLAAQANVLEGIKNPIHTFHTNIDSQLNLFTVLREKEFIDTRILIVSSAEVYGSITPQDLPVNEMTPFRPVNPYAVSKVAQDLLGYQYFVSYTLPIIRVRPFNHIGPGQAPTFVVSDFAKQIAEIEKGKREPVMRVGNLEAKRDFTDVRDMVRLYALLLEKGEIGEAYNAGSGTAHSAQEILNLLLSFTKTTISVEPDPAKMRPSDVPKIIADSTKVQEAVGWKAQIPFEQTIQETLEYWRGIV